MEELDSGPTWIACLTPPGAGAIATLAVRGPKGWPVTHSLFRPRLPEIPIPGKFYLGRLGADASTCDEIVVAVKSEGVELHCHGGVEVVRFIQELFADRGAVPCTWENLPPSPELSPLQALARNQLVQAPTVKTAAILLDQFHGAFETKLAEIEDCYQRNAAAAMRILGRLRETQSVGRHLVQPVRIVIAGPPNVGKSSLVNAMAGFTRSVVSPIPGTTRDVVTTRIALDGWPVELIDTVGLHASVDALENEGMARTNAVLADADLRLWVVDASSPPIWPPPKADWSGIIINKMDLPALWDTLSTRSRLDAGTQSSPTSQIRVSCKTGQGMPEACQWIVSLLNLAALTPGEGVAFTPELAESMVMAHNVLLSADWPRLQTIVKELLRAPP